MIVGVKEKLKENEIIYFWGKLLRNCRKSDFRQLVMKYSGADIVCVNHPGKLYPDCLVYPIMGDGCANTGFFAQLRHTLNLLSYADFYKLTPVICWTGEWNYKEEKLVNGTNNVYEYYFQQPSNIAEADINRCRNVVNSSGGGQKFIDLEWNAQTYRDMHSFVGQYSSLYLKYCKLNMITKRYIDENIENLLNKKKTLGIHVRSTDFKKAFDKHPVYVNKYDFLEPAKKLLEKYSYQQIFLATDSMEAVELFRGEFGDKLVFYNDVLRSDGDVGVHCLKSKRVNHHYKLGLEILRDCYTLASCDSLLAGLSQVSFAARYIRVANGMEYNDIVILDHGINRNYNKTK